MDGESDVQVSAGFFFTDTIFNVLWIAAVVLGWCGVEWIECKMQINAKMHE